MKIKLVRPNYDSHLITPPLGLGYLSACLKEKGFATDVIDALNLRLSNDAVAERCQDADLVGVTCLSAYFREVIDLCGKLKRAGKTIVVGGPHPSVLPELTLNETHADFVVVGEGERTLTELAEHLSAGRPVRDVPGVCSNDVPRFRPRPFIDRLDDLPLPDWDQIDPRRYPQAPHGGIFKSFPIAPVITTRGCPYSCSFCASPKIWARKIRFRSPTRVVDEVELLVRRYGVREIHFEDDNITLRTSHIEAICREMLNRKLRVDWALPNGIRVDRVSPQLFRLMRQSGCYSVAFGIESGSQRILDGVNKHTDLATIARAVTDAKSAGLVTQGFFIYGLPGETEATMRQTLDFAMSLPLDKAQFLILDVLPGSQLWEELNTVARPS